MIYHICRGSYQVYKCATHGMSDSHQRMFKGNSVSQNLGISTYPSPHILDCRLQSCLASWWPFGVQYRLVVRCLCLKLRPFSHQVDLPLSAVDPQQTRVVCEMLAFQTWIANLQPRQSIKLNKKNYMRIYIYILIRSFTYLNLYIFIFTINLTCFISMWLKLNWQNILHLEIIL